MRKALIILALTSGAAVAAQQAANPRQQPGAAVTHVGFCTKSEYETDAKALLAGDVFDRCLRREASDPPVRLTLERFQGVG